ncbi:carbohydrate ABC transporter permease [Nonomuraea sp. NPDC050556]|uniref:carbohydrate ABC transporter permease n=1 Tax=Nonomuraea sp. NPDC050556 TaxID=3364369 RepID=UPI0037AC09CB
MRRVAHVALLFWAVVVVVPMAWTLLASFKNTSEIFGPAWSLPARLRVDNWVRAFEQAHIGTYLGNTVLVVALSTSGTMLLGSMAAYVLARYPFRGSHAIYLVLVSGMAFPVYLALTPLFFVVRNTGQLIPFIGLDTHGGLVLVYIAYSLPFTVFFLTAFFKTLPESVAEAAFMDGASHSRVFFQVMLPMARPALVSITIFNVLGQWNQYQLPLILLSGNARDKWVLTQGIADISTAAGYNADWGALFAALSMAILPMLLVYVIFQRHIQSGLTEGALK